MLGKKPPGTTLGFCVPLPSGKVEVALDGLDREDGGDVEHDRQGTYAHEMGHAVDGARAFLSRQEDWKAAWMAEVNVPAAPFSKYARRNPQDGWAEFARLLWGGQHAREDVKAAFPKCWACWAERGLI